MEQSIRIWIHSFSLDRYHFHMGIASILMGNYRKKHFLEFIFNYTFVQKVGIRNAEKVDGLRTMDSPLESGQFGIETIFEVFNVHIGSILKQDLPLSTWNLVCSNCGFILNSWTFLPVARSIRTITENINWAWAIEITSQVVFC